MSLFANQMNLVVKQHGENIVVKVVKGDGSSKDYLNVYKVQFENLKDGEEKVLGVLNVG